MTVQELVETLKAMREEKPVDVMTRLFGVLFCAEIEASGSSPASIARVMTGKETQIGTTIRDGMTLAPYVTANAVHVQKWREGQGVR